MAAPFNAAKLLEPQLFLHPQKVFFVFPNLFESFLFHQFHDVSLFPA